MTDRSNLSSFPRDGVAVVIGASGGIGSAIYEQIVSTNQFETVIATSRNGQTAVDIQDEKQIASLASSIKAGGQDLRLVFDATGYLHGAYGNPEKTWSTIDPAAIAHQFAINAIGPALLMKHLLPLFPREGKAVFASLSAKVGSIGDNQLGGWYGYRSAKAALNQLIKTASIELARKRPNAICVGLHPGTVATQLSDPFAKQGVRLQSPAESAAALLSVIDSLSPTDSGALISYDGRTLPF